jgi:hypothetical protein
LFLEDPGWEIQANVHEETAFIGLSIVSCWVLRAEFYSKSIFFGREKNIKKVIYLKKWVVVAIIII